MSLLGPTSRGDQAGRYVGRRVSSDEELIRCAVECWGRERWPNARVCHELVVGRGQNRADLAFIDTGHLVSVEIKSAYDSTERLINQVAMFRLASPETWIITDPRHVKDAELVRYLLPSVGIAVAHDIRNADGERSSRLVKVVAEPADFVAEPAAMLSLLWVAELHDEAKRLRLWQGKAGSHAALVKRFLSLTYPEQVAAVCRQLRARDAVWRADPPVREAA